MKHNFTNLDYSFATIDGEEFGNCIINVGGFSLGNITHGATFPSSENNRIEQSRANARRITACVNYCTNMSTEELERKGVVLVPNNAVIKAKG